jgi:hypothetical protein
MASGPVLARDKRVASRAVQMLMLLPAVLFGLATLGLVAGALVVGGPATLGFAGGAAGAALLSAMSVAMWITGSVLRTVVTRHELHVQCGLLGPRIPIERIKTCRVGEQHTRVRTGTRLEDGMWTTSYLLGFGEYVEVVYTNERGRDRRVLFSATDPHAIAQAIQSARGQATGDAGALRIAETPARDEVLLDAPEMTEEERREHRA